MVHYERASVGERRTLPPAVAVSTVAFSLRPPLGSVVAADTGTGPTLWIPLVRRTRAPFLGRWALPGGPTQWNETLTDTALRSLHDAVLRAPGHLEQLYSFGGVERSAEAQRLVTIAYWALYSEVDLAAAPSFAAGTDDGAADESALGVSGEHGEPERPTGGRSGVRWDEPEPPEPQPAGAVIAGAAGGFDELDQSDDPNVSWFSADALPDLAFDHAEIVAYALARLRSKTEYAAIAHRLLDPVFTLGQLRAVHEAVRGERVDPANFRRQELARGTLIDTGELETGTRHRPARLYRFRDVADVPGADVPGAERPSAP